LQGTNTHDRFGELRREGGGKSEGYSSEVKVVKPPVTINQVKKAAENVKKLTV